MPKYKFVAYNLKGERAIGERTAQNPDSLKIQLKNEKLILNNFSEQNKIKKRNCTLLVVKEYQR